jgi:hypothetical protein
MTSTRDIQATYDRRTETIRTGSGRYVRAQELYRALATLNQVQLERLIKKAELTGAVSDPFEASRATVVEDIINLCRTRPQYCMPVIETARRLPTAGARFADLVRDRAVGSGIPEADRRLRATGGRATYQHTITQYFFETRTWKGDLQILIDRDGKLTTHAPGDGSTADLDYDHSFVVVRTSDKHYWLRWPERDPECPACYLDERGERVAFLPHPIPGAIKGFEEIFPGHNYEVFGVRFQLPDLGVDYSNYYNDEDDLWKDWDPSDYRRSTRPTTRSQGPEPADGLHALLRVLELTPGQVRTAKELSKHYRLLSVRYHPLKHLRASDDERARVNERYAQITQAYNELKAFFS